MDLNLSSFFHLSNQNNGNVSAGQLNETSASQGTSFNHAMNAARNLTAGQTISGEIVAIRDGEVDIALGKDMYLTAKLDRDINLVLGQTLTFQVKSTAGNRIALSPLYENMAQNPTISNAIQAAHIPLNQTSASMVHVMMENGMPIDSKSLQDMYRQVMNHPETSGETIVQMNRLQIPVTPDNIQQFGVYQNYEHSIMEAVSTIGDDLADMFHQVVQGGNTGEISEFLQKMVQIFGQETTQSGITGDGKITIAEGNIAMDENGAVKLISGEDAGDGESLKSVNATVDNSGFTADKVDVEKAILSQTREAVVLEDSVRMEEQGSLKEGTSTNMEQLVVSEQGQQIFSTQLGLPQGAAMKLAGMLEQLGMDPKLTELVKNGGITSEALLQHIAEQVRKAEKGELLKALLNSKELTSLVKNQVGRQWMLQPEDVAEEGKIEELYRRIQQQTAKLADSISGLAKDNSSLAKSVSNLSGNVEFMNQLNQVFTYVQLPLKMGEGNAHGELYVYTNKKNLAKKDGNVSALLHLDMEHLGSMDIYVAMQQSKVSTKFYLEKEEYIDFIGEHIHLLNERLEKRGYSMKAEFIQKEGRTNVMEEMLQQDNGGNGMMISQYAFDARA